MLQACSLGSLQGTSQNDSPRGKNRITIEEFRGRGGGWQSPHSLGIRPRVKSLRSSYTGLHPQRFPVPCSWPRSPPAPPIKHCIPKHLNTQEFSRGGGNLPAAPPPHAPPREPAINGFILNDEVKRCSPVNFTKSKTQPFQESSPSPWQQRPPSLSRRRRPPLRRR